MPRTADRSLLPAALRARLDAGDVNNGEYHRLLPTYEALASAAAVARGAVPCRWGPADLVYDGSIHHTIIPELARRVAALVEAPQVSR